jgi:hypothetical protein
MRKLLLAGAAACALAFAGTAGASLQPGVFDPGNTGCVTSTYSQGVLHLAKNCASSTNAAAGADITGLDGQAFQSASFTLANASQCQGGSPRFDISTTNGLFFLGCNNVTPTTNPDGTVTYSFAPSNLIPADPTKTTPGTITGVEVLIDVQGTADLSRITVNGVLEKPVPKALESKRQCMKGGWKAAGFRNQGQCISHFNHVLHQSTHKNHH